MWFWHNNICQKEKSCTWSNRSSVKIKTKHSTASDVNVTESMQWMSYQRKLEGLHTCTQSRSQLTKFCKICSCALKSSIYFKRVSADLEFVAYYCWQTMWELPWYSRWRSRLFLFLGISWGNTKIEQRSGQWVGESLLAGRIAGEGKGGINSISPTRSSLRRSISAFLQLILRNRKRLLAVYDTRKPAVSVLNVEVKSEIFAVLFQ